MAINNSVTLTGNLGGEARIHEMKDGRLFAAFSLATTDSYKDEKGQWHKKKPIWHNVLTFNPLLVQMLKGFKPGLRLSVEGSLSYKEIPKKVKGNKTIKIREASVIAFGIEPRPLIKKATNESKAQEQLALDQA